MDANKLPRLFSKGNVAFVADDAEDSRGKAGGKCRLRGEVRGGYTSGIIGVWRAMSALGGTIGSS